jgi:hypothetical protein
LFISGPSNGSQVCRPVGLTQRKIEAEQVIIVLPRPEISAGCEQPKACKFYDPGPFKLPLGEESWTVFRVNSGRPFQVDRWHKPFGMFQKKRISFESYWRSFGMHFADCGSADRILVQTLDNEPRQK